MTRDTAICMLPNTATTSRILSSNDGAENVWGDRQVDRQVETGRVRQVDRHTGRDWYVQTGRQDTE